MILRLWRGWTAKDKTFGGPDWEISVVPPAARAVLARYDERATHYETLIGAPESPAL